MGINLKAIPNEPKNYPNWVCWQLREIIKGKPTKIPKNPHTGGYAKSNEPQTWSGFEDACKFLNSNGKRVDGIGFVVSSNDPFTGIDLDHCRDAQTGIIEAWAMGIIKEGNSYTEITPSGTGIRIFVKGNIPRGRKKGNIEAYSSGRFFTVTGNHLEGTPTTIESRQTELDSFYKKYFGDNEPQGGTIPKPIIPTSLRIQEIIEKAKQASNGDKFSKLWAGDWSDYPSQSEADLALCSMLASWTGRDPTRIDQLFRQSGLMREKKWDEKHFGDGRTYGQGTIDKAIKGTTETYTGPQSQGENVSAKVKPRELFYLNLNLPSSLEISQLDIKVEWLVENLIPKESITLLHSIGGVGKSYLMYQLAKAVADGESFFGLNVMQTPVYYIDHENPLSEIADRMRKIGGSENLKIWHLGHDPMPIRFDADEWEIYKTFPPGLFIIDSLRSSYMDEENSSKVAAFVMARLKEIRALGSTFSLIHHENKLGGYRGSTAWFDLSDHILKFSRVRKVGSDEDVEEDDFDLPIRLGLGGKSRFSSAIELKPMYFKFENHQLCCADDPESEILNKMAGLLSPVTPPNQSEFQKLTRQNLGIGQKDFRKLLKKGKDRKIWFSKQSGSRNKLEYFRT